MTRHNGAPWNSWSLSDATSQSRTLLVFHSPQQNFALFFKIVKGQTYQVVVNTSQWYVALCCNPNRTQKMGWLAGKLSNIDHRFVGIKASSYEMLGDWPSCKLPGGFLTQSFDLYLCAVEPVLCQLYHLGLFSQQAWAWPRSPNFVERKWSIEIKLQIPRDGLHSLTYRWID